MIERALAQKKKRKGTAGGEGMVPRGDMKKRKARKPVKRSGTPKPGT